MSQFAFESLAFTYQGQRDKNEDSIYPLANGVSSTHRVFIVCDGMGGHAKGEIASKVVCDALSKLDDTACKGDASLIVDALQKAYQTMHALSDVQNARRMGTTLAMLLCTETGAVIAHIGDSRVYHIRINSDKMILHKTRDHSLAMDMIEQGVLNQDELQSYPKKNIITKAFMSDQIDMTLPDIHPISDIQVGDYFFLCTDGVWGNLNDDALMEILSNSTSNAVKMDGIASKCSSSDDNYSACLVQVVHQKE